MVAQGFLRHEDIEADWSRTSDVEGFYETWSQEKTIMLYLLKCLSKPLRTHGILNDE